MTATGSATINGESKLKFDGTQLLAFGGTTESQPDYSFGNDTDTGLFRVTTNTVGLSLAGTEEFRWVINGTDGDFHATGDVIAFSTTPSDIRLKTNIEDIDKGLDTIMNLRPVSYDWKHKETDSFDYGLIAQEVEKVIPSIVKEKELIFTEENETYKTVSYERLIPILIKSIQELNEEINKLKGK